MTARDRNRYLLIRRLLILYSSVVRGTPSFLAAPSGPEMRPRVSASATSMSSRSWLSDTAAGRPKALLPAATMPLRQRTCPSRRGSWLVGSHFEVPGYCQASDSLQKFRCPFFYSSNPLALFRSVAFDEILGEQKNVFGRSRSGGTWIGKTFNR